MNNPKKSFILHLDSLCVLDEMTLEQKGILFDAIYNFQLGVDVELDFSMKMAFAPFRNQFIRDNEKYTQFIERQTNNGKKGGRKVETQANPENPSLPKEAKPTLNDSVSDSDNVKEKENDNESESVKKESTHETFKPTVIFTSPEIENQEQRKVAPKESENEIVVYPIEEIKIRLSEWEYELIENSCKVLKISREEYKAGVDLFLYQQGDEGMKKDYTDVKKHFRAWLKNNITNIHKSINNQNNSNGKPQKIGGIDIETLKRNRATIEEIKRKGQDSGNNDW